MLRPLPTWLCVVEIGCRKNSSHRKWSTITVWRWSWISKYPLPRSYLILINKIKLWRDLMIYVSADANEGWLLDRLPGKRAGLIPDKTCTTRISLTTLWEEKKLTCCKRLRNLTIGKWLKTTVNELELFHKTSVAPLNAFT